MPVRRGRVHVLDLAPLRVEHQHSSTTAPHVRLEDRPGGADPHFEALPHYGLGVGVEQDGDLVAGRVLELLDHQLTATRGRSPVDAAQGFSLLVLAHAVQLEAAVAPQQQPLAVM